MKLAWGALVGASAFTVLAVVAMPRRASVVPLPPEQPPRSPSECTSVESAAVGDVVVNDPAMSEAALAGAPSQSAALAASFERERRAPATSTSVPDARVALCDMLEDARGLDPMVLADAAVGLGPELVPSLLDGMLGRGEWPESEHAATADLRVVALRDAWERYEPDLRAKALVECHAATRDERRVLVELAGELGGEVALPTVLRIARGLEPLDLARDFVAEPVERALAQALVSSKASERNLETLLAQQPSELARVIVRGWAQSGDARGPALAARALGREAALDLEILAAVAQPSCPARAALGERALAAARRALASADPKARRAAAAVFGNARDTQTADALVGALDDVDALVRAAARDALRAITGRDLGGDSEAWRAWSSERHEWLADARTRQLSRATGSDCGEAMEALGEMLARPDAYDELVDGLAELHGATPCGSVRERVRSALEEIGSARALALVRQADG
ncbi:MAG: hypothetical protein FJ298_07585 [Planctomycetes bacterium]|nr:hypothetical protein [Planctomycetota bacterium]